MDTPTFLELPPALETPLTTSKIDYKQRNKDLIRDYASGLKYNELAIKYNISQGRITQILGSNPDLLAVSEAEETIRRHRSLRKLEDKAPKMLAPKNVTEYVAVLEAQRKNLEPEKSGVNIDNRSITITSPEDQSELISIAANSSRLIEQILGSHKYKQLLGLSDTKGQQLQKLQTGSSSVQTTSKTYSLIDRAREIREEGKND